MKIIWSQCGLFHIEVTLNTHDLTCLMISQAERSGSHEPCVQRNLQSLSPTGPRTSKAHEKVHKAYAKSMQKGKTSSETLRYVRYLRLIFSCIVDNKNVVRMLSWHWNWTVVAFMKLVRGRLGLLGLPSYTHQISIKYSPRGVTCSDLVMAASAWWKPLDRPILTASTSFHFGTSQIIHDQ